MGLSIVYQNYAAYTLHRWTGFASDTSATTTKYVFQSTPDLTLSSTEDSSWIQRTSSLPPLLALCNVSRASPHLLGNLLALDPFSIKQQQVLLFEVADEVIRIKSSSSSLTYRINSLWSAEYFFETALLLHFGSDSRELIMFSNRDDRRDVLRLLQQRSPYNAPRIPYALLGRIFYFLDDLSWSRAALVCLLWCREAAKDAVARKRGVGDRLIVQSSTGTQIIVGWRLPPERMEELNQSSPWIAACTKMHRIGEVCSTYATYSYPENRRLTVGGTATLSVPNGATFACIALVISSRKV